MSGHSKWSTIKHKKGAADAKRGKIFQKLSKEIFIAAKNGGASIDSNAALRLAVEKAKMQSMPKDNIQRAIDKAAGNTSGEAYDEIMYEGYGPNGIAVMVFCLTDNRNRTASTVRSTFSKRGGNLGADGSVAYLFNRKGYIALEAEKLVGIDAEEFILNTMELDIDEITDEDGVIVITTDPSSFEAVKNELDATEQISEYLKAEVTMVASMEVELEEADAEKVERLIDELEDNDDVQEVYHNMK
ncbi:MAG: YebC/PmpR family DNA-binding transcriptional regulator [Mycoplasmatales bacterium]